MNNLNMGKAKLYRVAWCKVILFTCFYYTTISMWDMALELPCYFKLPMEKLLGCYVQVWLPYDRPDIGALRKWQDLEITQPKELSQYTWGFEECCEAPRNFLAILNCTIELRITKIILITDISIWNVDGKL